MLNYRCRLNQKGKKLSSQEVGRLGEKIAKHWLLASGTRVLFQNFKSPYRGEVDLIVQENDTLVFIEVKTRTRSDFGRAFDSVDKKKQALIQRGANHWLSLLGKKREKTLWRYDVIEILLQEGEKPKVSQIRNAF